MKEPIYKIELKGAGMWSKVIGKGKVLKLTDLEGGANVGMLLYHANLLTERYNMPDTLKGQHTFFLRKGLCLHTDMGRLIASIVEDSCGWHDTVCGTSDAADIKKKYGDLSFQEARNDWHRSGTECFLIELAKWGMGEKDLMPNLNFFSKVAADDDGVLHYAANHSKAGDSVSLRMEMDALVIMNTCQHSFSPAGAYVFKPVLLEVYEGASIREDDECHNSRPENARAYRNTVDYHKLRGTL
jgi:uncharacterized protein